MFSATGHQPPVLHTYLLLLGHLLLGLGDDLLLLGEDHLDVARGAHVGVDAAVGTVRAPAHLGGFVDLDVLDHQGVNIQTLQERQTDRRGSQVNNRSLNIHLGQLQGKMEALIAQIKKKKLFHG